MRVVSFLLQGIQAAHFFLRVKSKIKAARIFYSCPLKYQEDLTYAQPVSLEKKRAYFSFQTEALNKP